MGYPKTCPNPECKADLTVMGAVGQEATERGWWDARVDERGYFEFGTFTTEDTASVERVYCEACDTDLEDADEEGDVDA